MDMRKSRVLRKMRQGEIAISAKINLADPRGAEIAAMCGYDCIWIDMEHVPATYLEVEGIIRAAKIYDVDVLTRVARGSYNDLIRPLEADSAGIMVPHLMSLEDAKRIVYYTKFHPIGRRPLDGGNADGKFCMIDGKEYMKQANEERFVVVQIEDPEPLVDLEKICKLPGIDMIFFGPADFSQGLGTPLDFSNPKIDETRKLVAKTAKKYGKFAGTTGGPGNIAELHAMGFDFVNIAADVIILGQNYISALEKARENLKNA